MANKKNDTEKKTYDKISKVKLRERERRDGKTTLYLDFYNPTSKKHEYEFTDCWLFTTPRNVAERTHNANELSRATEILNERCKSIEGGCGSLKREVTSTPEAKLAAVFERVVNDLKKDERESMNRHTWARTVEYTGQLVELYRPNARLEDVNRDFVLGFIDYLKHEYTIGRHQQNAGQHLKPSSAEKKYTAFKFVMQQAVVEGWISRNPFDMIKDREKIEVNESSREYLTEDELRTLAATPTRSEATKQAYLFMCFCGLRISDVKSLRWSDIERSENRLFVRIRQQKTQKPIVLPLSDIARQFLPEQGEKPLESHVFDALPTEPAMNRSLKLWAKRAGITKNVTLHTARHTFATVSLRQGVDLYTVSKLLGHSEISTTQIYAKIVDEAKAEAVDKLNNLLK